MVANIDEKQALLKEIPKVTRPSVKLPRKVVRKLSNLSGKQRLSLCCILALIVLFQIFLFRLIEQHLIPNEISEKFKEDLEWSVDVVGPECPKSHHINLVKSGRKNFQLRKQIRKYYKNLKLGSKEQMTPIFIFGKSREQNDLFEEEKEEHGDFIIGDFEDSYQNLPLKTLSGYTYLSKYCKFEIDWVTFHDDDVFIDHLRLEKILQRQSPSIKSKFLCPFRVAPAKLQSTDKFTFQENLWDPQITNFPAYCAGPCTTMSGKSAEKIFNTAKVTNWRGFGIEDVLFTGIIRRKADLPPPPLRWDRSICTHYNEISKISDLTERVDQFISEIKT